MNHQPYSQMALLVYRVLGDPRLFDREIPSVSLQSS